MGSEVVCACAAVVAVVVVVMATLLGVNSSSLHDRDTCWERRGREKTEGRLSAWLSHRFRVGFSLLRNF